MTVLRHPAPVGALAFGRLDDAEILVAGCHDGTVRIWDPVAGTAIGDPLPGPTAEVYAVATTPGRVFAVSADAQIYAWNTEYGETFPEWTAQSGADLLAGGSHGGRAALFAVAGRFVDVWDAGTGDRLTGLDLRAWLAESWVNDIEAHEEPVRALAVRGDLLVTSDGYTQWVWDADSHGSMYYNRASRWAGLVDVDGPAGAALGIGRFGDRDVVANPHHDGPIWTHDPIDGTPTGPPLRGCPPPVRAVAVASVGGRDAVVAVGADPAVHVWFADLGTAVVELPEPASALAVSPETGRIFVATGPDVRTADPGHT